MYNPKSYTNYINNKITQSFKAGTPMLVYSLPDNVYFIAFTTTTHFIHSCDLTFETLAIIAQKQTEYTHACHLSNLVYPSDATTDIKLVRSYTPIEKCGLKRLLEYKNHYSHFLNETLLKKFGKLEKLLLACVDTGKFDNILVYRDNGTGWTNAEYLGAICPINPKLEKFEKELEFV